MVIEVYVEPYATVHYPHIRGYFGRAVSWTVDLDIEIFFKFPKIFATAFFKAVKAIFYWITIKSEILISFVTLTTSTKSTFTVKILNITYGVNVKQLQDSF